MKVAISQPTYLPWIGYFDLIDQVDRFVFLDTVQFEKRSWQQRNRIRTAEGLLFLTVPVIVKGRFEQKIKDVEIESPFFVRKHLRTIESNYRRAPFFGQYFEELAGLLGMCTVGTRLAEVTGVLGSVVAVQPEPELASRCSEVPAARKSSWGSPG